MTFKIKKATRSQTKLRLALCGTSGSGKSYTALTLARQLVGAGSIVVIDLESVGDGIGATEMYDQFGHNVLVMEPPFRPMRIQQAIEAAINEGAEVIIIDSYSLVWNGPGGALETVDEIEKTNRNGGWRVMTPELNDLLTTINRAPCHMIVTMRVDSTVSISKNESGKTVIEKIPEKIVQRKDVDYEFSVVFMLRDGNIYVQKTRYPELPENGVFNRADPEVVALLMAACDSGIEPPVTRNGFMATLRRWGIKTPDQFNQLKADLPNLGAWSADRHYEMLEMVKAYWNGG